MGGRIARNEQALNGIVENETMLSHVCTTLSEALDDRKIVPERTLLDFSRMTCQLIYDGLSDGIPAGFTELTEAVEEYWHYIAHKDKNVERRFSYIRLYQITSMVRIFERERQQEQLIFDLTEKNRKHSYLLRCIHDSPGITHKELSKKLSISPSMLSHRTDQLEAQGILDNRRIGKCKYYSLSNLGLSLYKRLEQESSNLFFGIVWSRKRLKILSRLLLGLSDVPSYDEFIGYDSKEIIHVLQVMNKWDDEIANIKVAQFLNAFSNPSNSAFPISFAQTSTNPYEITNTLYSGKEN